MMPVMRSKVHIKNAFEARVEHADHEEVPRVGIITVIHAFDSIELK